MNDEAGRQARSDNHSSAPRLPGVPALTIRLEPEAPPSIRTDALNEAEASRLNDWILAHGDLIDLLDRALLAREAWLRRAA